MQKACLLIRMNPMRVDGARGLSFFANKTLYLVQIFHSFWYQLVTDDCGGRGWRLDDFAGNICRLWSELFAAATFHVFDDKEGERDQLSVNFSKYKSPCLFTSRCTWRRLGRLKLLICCRLHIWQLKRSDKGLINRWLTCIWRRIKLLTEVSLTIIVFTYYLLCRVSIIIPCKN